MNAYAYELTIEIPDPPQTGPDLTRVGVAVRGPETRSVSGLLHVTDQATEDQIRGYLLQELAADRVGDVDVLLWQLSPVGEVTR